MNPAKRLLKLLVHEISVVGKPAVPRAQIMLMKQDTRDAFQKADDLIRQYKPSVTVESALELARAQVPLPRSYWQEILETVGAAVAPGQPPSARLLASIRTDAGQLLLKALQHAPWR